MCIIWNRDSSSFCRTWMSTYLSAICWRHYSSYSCNSLATFVTTQLADTVKFHCNSEFHSIPSQWAGSSCQHTSVLTTAALQWVKCGTGRVSQLCSPPPDYSGHSGFLILPIWILGSTYQTAGIFLTRTANILECTAFLTILLVHGLPSINLSPFF